MNHRKKASRTLTAKMLRERTVRVRQGAIVETAEIVARVRTAEAAVVVAAIGVVAAAEAAVDAVAMAATAAAVVEAAGSQS